MATNTETDPGQQECADELIEGLLSAVKTLAPCIQHSPSHASRFMKAILTRTDLVPMTADNSRFETERRTHQDQCASCNAVLVLVTRLVEARGGYLNDAYRAKHLLNALDRYVIRR
jgi:hypothetical protein